MSAPQSIPQDFDLEQMKRLLGSPVLLGAEKKEDFDEFAYAMAAAQEPGDMAAHVLVYQYVLETWGEMRLRRLQGHLNRLYGLNATNLADLAKLTHTCEAEAKAFTAQQQAHAAHARVDFLLTQGAKRSANLLAQIAMHRVALAEKIRIQLDIELRHWKIKETKHLAGEEDTRDQTAN